VPQAWRSRLHELVDRAIALAREVAERMDNEAEVRRATIPYGQKIELHGFDFLRAAVRLGLFVTQTGSQAEKLL
jgi:hypothetical protein